MQASSIYFEFKGEGAHYFFFFFNKLAFVEITQTVKATATSAKTDQDKST